MYWVERTRTCTNTANASRRGLVISLSSSDGILVGLGETSPPKGVTPKPLLRLKNRSEIQNSFFTSDFVKLNRWTMKGY